MTHPTTHVPIIAPDIPRTSPHQPGPPETDTSWLSHIPFEPGSRFSGAGCPRLATFVLFGLSGAAGNYLRNIALIDADVDRLRHQHGLRLVVCEAYHVD